MTLKKFMPVFFAEIFFVHEGAAHIKIAPETFTAENLKQQVKPFVNLSAAGEKYKTPLVPDDVILQPAEIVARILDEVHSR